jgi:hypothetical protein
MPIKNTKQGHVLILIQGKMNHVRILHLESIPFGGKHISFFASFHSGLVAVVLDSVLEVEGGYGFGFRFYFLDGLFFFRASFLNGCEGGRREG